MKKQVVITYKQTSDPSPKQTQDARNVVDAIDGARLLDEIPGTLKVEVSKKRAMKQLSEQVGSLDDWELSEEGLGKMPIEGGGNRKPTK